MCKHQTPETEVTQYCSHPALSKERAVRNQDEGGSAAQLGDVSIVSGDPSSVTVPLAVARKRWQTHSRDSEWLGTAAAVHRSTRRWNDPMTVRIALTVNEHDRTLEVEAGTPLLYVLRNDLSLNGPKFGCGLAQCGACTVIMNGQAIRSCVTPIAAAANARITTLEGLGTADDPHPIQQAFIDEQAAQCGYCTNGMIMTAKALLDRQPDSTEQQIRAALAGNLCRCGTHIEILAAVKRAAEARRTERRR
jgi:nicotinate dehydrogenase subunit A